MSDTLATGGLISERMVRELAATKPWIRLVAIFGFVGAGLLILAGGVMLVLVIVGAAAGTDLGAVETFLLGTVYLLCAAVYFTVSLVLNRCATAIARAVREPGAGAIEAALARQKEFWRLVGILSILVTALYALAVVVLVIVGVIAALMSA